MGAVYKALDLHVHRRLVAVKEMSQNGLSDQELREATAAFAYEAQLLACLNHPNLPQIYKQFEENGRRYLVMDFIEGVTLEQHGGAYWQQEKQIPVEAVLSIGIQLCSVLDYLHMQQPPIIFRDLKPSNIMLTPQGKVYLIDFGIARLFKPGQVKDTIALGSPGYAPPEQYCKATSPQSDIYSLGVVLHQLLTGDDPSQNPFQLKPFSLNVPALEKLVMSMVEANALDRPVNMRSVYKVLRDIAQGFVHSDTEVVRGQTMPRAGIVTGIKPVNIYVVLSSELQDQRIWESIQDHLKVLIDAIPDAHIRQSCYSAQQGAQSNTIDHADLILFLLSEDFLASPDCMADVERTLRQGGKMLSLLLRSCMWQKTSLAHIPFAIPESIAHPSLYAQEQRILEAARAVHMQLVTLIMMGKQVGPMNLLQWLFWQLYGNGGSTCPYFVVGRYELKYVRSSRHAGVLFHLSDRRTGHVVANYMVSSHTSARLTELLRIIAPSRTTLFDVQGVAMRERPQ